MTIEGGCRCGAARYTLALDRLPPVYCCHCRDCQTWSGSAFSMQAVVGEGAIAATGPIVEYASTSPGGSTSRQRLCGTCHTRLWNTNSARPGLAVVRAGSLDASDTLVPRAHIWVKRKQPWVVLNDVPSFAEAPDPAAFFAALTADAGG